MLTAREYFPNDDDILYHYCGPESFFGLTKLRRFWFSDLFSMNDSMELHWGYGIFEHAANELIDEIPESFFDKVDEIISSTTANILPLICCFSLDGDVLSQWRSYANDGRGFSIGFSAKELKKMPVRMLKVQYDRNEQIKEMKDILRAVHDVEINDGYKYGKGFMNVCREIAIDLCAFKNPAFREEQEVRLAHTIVIQSDKTGLSLKSSGGTAWGRRYKGGPVNFRLRDEITVPYVDLDFTNNGSINPIKQIILGPKNRNLPSNIHVYLQTIGLKGIEINRSSASYV